MIKPAYKLTVGNQLVDTTDEPQASTLIDLRVDLDIDAINNQFKLILGNVGHLTPTREDDAIIELGYSNNETALDQVISGKVSQVTQGSTKDEIIGYSAAKILLHSFKDQTFESKTAGDIVNDLASDASVNVNTAESGINFPAYVIDSRKSYYHHIKDLAHLCGFDFYLNSDNEIIFKKFVAGNLTHVFEHSQHIIQLDVQHFPLSVQKVEVFGESGTTQGTESWAWLTKDFKALAGNSVSSNLPLGGSGSGNSTLVIQQPVLRTGQAAQTSADAKLKQIQRREIRGSLLSMGRPKVKLGDAIRLSGLSESELNKTFQVRAITHRINKHLGFVSNIKFNAIVGIG